MFVYGRVYDCGGVSAEIPVHGLADLWSGVTQAERARRGGTRDSSSAGGPAVCWQRIAQELPLCGVSGSTGTDCRRAGLIRFGALRLEWGGRKTCGIEDLHIMLQNLLTERFKLRFHHEAKDMLAYVLAVDKNGPKNLKAHANASGDEVNLERTVEEVLHEKWSAHCASMDFFVWRFSAWLDQPMINQTGLKGWFDFELAFTREPPRGALEGQLPGGFPIDTSGPTIYQALQNQLVFKFESKKASVETMVIDYAERPAEN
jgi:uncharacterized protein (TIGR03435 family)